MNSLNIVTRLATTPPVTPSRSRTSSSLQEDPSSQNEKSSKVKQSASELDLPALSEKLGTSYTERDGVPDAPDDIDDERTPLLGEESQRAAPGQTNGRLWEVPRRVARAIFYGAAVVIRTITAPGRYVIACFYDKDGHFSAILPLKNLRSLLSKRSRKSAAQVAAPNSTHEPAVPSEKNRPPSLRKTSRLRSPSVESTASTTEGETETEKGNDGPARHTRSKTASASAEQGDDIAPHRKSGRVKLLHNDEALRKRKLARAQQKKAQTASPDDVAALASSLKSPSSPTASTKVTRYPRSPAPPRPLVPRRQPSYVLSYSAETPKKTLIIDLDETLIHSMAKGGRMSTGHMVEVRLGGTVSSAGISLGPGVPILYYVHERPGCHEFLRKVSKWYNLVIFTASVQEYADPVLDWLERERRYFSGRYYRQHCTFRNGAYIKDLAQIEPDLSKVMILDNSPMSYIFHEDNAIPIEGWISDPTDNDLLHLIPFLEGLQYVNDVRALLALRQGQAPQA